MSKSNATRKPYSRILSIAITNKMVDRMIGQKHHEEYLAEKEMYNNSYEGQLDNACRSILQEANKSMDEINRLYVKTVSDLADNLFNTAHQFLSEQSGDLQSLSLEQIEEFMKHSNLVFKKINTMCKNPQYLEIVKSNQSNDYDKLFKRLIEEVNPQFIVFAPNNIVGIKQPFKGISKMPQEAKERLFARVQELGLDKDIKYMESHKGVFKEFINQQPQQKVETNLARVQSDNLVQ